MEAASQGEPLMAASWEERLEEVGAVAMVALTFAAAFETAASCAAAAYPAFPSWEAAAEQDAALVTRLLPP